MKPLLLIILDGYALNPNPLGNAVFHAKKPTMDRLMKTCPQTTLTTFGPRVGLPEGQMGNSEVGHLNIGGGRIVQQELTRIDLAIAQKQLVDNKVLQQAVAAAATTSTGALQLIGLASSGGVHSSMDHLFALIDGAVELGAKRIFVHAITDGRDRPPTASLEELGRLALGIEARCREHPGLELAIGSVTGRYFAMDRDKRWERTKKAFEALVGGNGEPCGDFLQGIAKQHAAGTTDEFLEPLIRNQLGLSRAPLIQSGDSLLFFNFRADRMRQIVSTFFKDFSGFERLAAPNVQICSLTEYQADFPVAVMFQPMMVKNHLGQVLSQAGLKQLRIAETEKYAHVTYFFNGGVEAPSQGEERILIPSPRDVATYDQKPEMSAAAVTDAILAKLEEGNTDVYVVNYANCDMVGHTGVFEAAVKAVETVDRCLGRVLTVVDALGGTAVITADHGNADQMVDYETGKPHTFHTTYPVPFLIYGRTELSKDLRSGGALCDIAPTICALLGIAVPSEMTGQSLL